MTSNEVEQLPEVRAPSSVIQKPGCSHFRGVTPITHETGTNPTDVPLHHCLLVELRTQGQNNSCTRLAAPCQEYFFVRKWSDSDVPLIFHDNFYILGSVSSHACKHLLKKWSRTCQNITLSNFSSQSSPCRVPASPPNSLYIVSESPSNLRPKSLPPNTTTLLTLIKSLARP